MRAGISSENSSSSRSGIWRLPDGIFTLTAGEPCLAAGFRKNSNAPDIGSAFRYADDPTRIEQIEIMARFQTLVIGGQRQSGIEQIFAFLFGIGEMPKQDIGIGAFEIVGRIFSFCLVKHFTIKK